MANLYDEAERELDRPLRAQYYTHIRDHARNAIQDVIREKKADDESLSEALDSAADYLVIYTQDAMFAIWESDNRDAYEDEGLGEIGDAKNLTDLYTKVAYYAVRRDLEESAATFGTTWPEKKRAVSSRK